MRGQGWVAALLVLFVTYISGERETGGFSDVIKPPFAIDNPLVRLLPDLAKEIRAKTIAKVPEDKNVLTAPIYLLAYKQQVIAGMKYLVETKVDNLKFIVHVIKPATGTAYADQVVGPLVDGSPDLLSKV